MTQSTCILAATDGPCGRVHAQGWCKKHHTRFLRHGDPLFTAKRGKGALLAELKAATKMVTDNCVILATPGDTRPVATLDGTFMLASRAVWILAHGDPGEAHVLHSCHRGEEGCINLGHLYLGDNDRNIQDMVDAGRSTRGERSGTHKLTEMDVYAIREAYAAGGVTYTALGDRFGVTNVSIRNVVERQTWRHLPEQRTTDQV